MINANYNTEAPRVMYGDACFLRICPECGRYVAADETITIYGHDGDEVVKQDEPNATCKQHGRVAMPFEGYF